MLNTSHGPQAPVQAPNLTDVVAVLANCGMKQTEIRLQILEALRELTPAGTLATAQSIYKAMLRRGGTPKLTYIYNVLCQLAERGAIARYRLGDHPSLFSLQPATGLVTLLVCDRCGLAEGNAALSTPPELLAVARAHGFVPSAPQVVLRGLCASCAGV